jgi:hypothetical protein
VDGSNIYNKPHHLPPHSISFYKKNLFEKNPNPKTQNPLQIYSYLRFSGQNSFIRLKLTYKKLVHICTYLHWLGSHFRIFSFCNFFVHFIFFLKSSHFELELQIVFFNQDIKKNWPFFFNKLYHIFLETYYQ